MIPFFVVRFLLLLELTSMTTIRPLTPDDFVALAALFNLVNFTPVPMTVETLTHLHNRKAPDMLTKRLVAETNGEITGYAILHHEASMPAEEFFVSVLTHPAHRCRGIGNTLYNIVMTAIRSNGGTRIKVEVPEWEPAGLRFAEQRGLGISRLHFYSKLNVATFDETPFAGIVEGLEAQGVRFFTMADVPDTEATQRQLYEVYRATSTDIPGENGYRPFEDFRDSVLGAAWYQRDAQLVAADGDTWVGICTLRHTPATASVYLQMTGVIRAYRGRKIATALKLLGVRWAKARGVDSISTANDSLNSPILAINQKMGFRPEPGRYQMVGTIV